MCIYCTTTNYRKIYKEHFGPIPIDEEGRSYDIHHRDGNSKNHIPENLEALSIQEHYDRHYEQGDYAACLLIAKQRLKKTKKELFELNRLSSLKRIKDKTHKFVDTKFIEKETKRKNDLVSKGIYHLQNDVNKIRSSKTQNKLLSYGRHNFQSKENEKKRLDSMKKARLEGRYKSNEIIICPHCKLEGQRNGMKRWHFNNCRNYIVAKE